MLYGNCLLRWDTGISTKQTKNIGLYYINYMPKLNVCKANLPQKKASTPKFDLKFLATVLRLLLETIRMSFLPGTIFMVYIFHLMHIIL